MVCFRYITVNTLHKVENKIITIINVPILKYNSLLTEARAHV